ncbi:MAG: fimbria/pilus outer membrane usher protein [Gemmatimonadota bacterium]
MKLVVNGKAGGDVFVERAAGGDFLVRASDLEAAGLKVVGGAFTELGGERFVSLRSVEGISYAFDEKTLSLDVTAAPGVLPVQTIDFTPRGHPGVERPDDASAFLNYRVGYAAEEGTRGWDVENQLGVRAGGVLFLSDSAYTRTPADSSFVRLQTSAIYDRRETMQRAVVGDTFASSGDLGNAVNLGGASVSKVYRIDPYFRSHPLASVSGLVATPSDAQVFLDGMLLRTETLSPGAFELKNLDYYGGASRLTVVIRDPFGREERIAAPFYFTDAVLRKGLHEYSYNAGFLRRDFGVRSNRYGTLAVSAIHNYGVSDAVTAGFRGEAGGGMANLGPQASVVLGNAGVVTSSVSGSHDRERGGGVAGLLRYVYQDNTASATLFAKGFSKGYALLDEGDVPYRPRYDAGAGAGYWTPRLGSISVAVGAAGTYGGPGRRSAAVTYAVRIARAATLYASYRRTRDSDSIDEVFVGVTYTLGPDASLSGSVRTGDGRTTETVQAQKYVPAGEGYGFRVQAERTDGGGEPATALNPFVQYNGRYGVLTGEYRGRYDDRGESRNWYRLTASGGIATVGGAVGLTRPVADSFGVVAVDNLAGVRVLVGNQEIGRTDAKGRAFVPSLGSYYENQVAIDDRDIPIDRAVGEVVKYVSPPLRSGSVIRFDAPKFQAVTGSLSVSSAGIVRPAAFVDVRATVAGKTIDFPTGRKGEFYVENVGPGSYPAAFDADGKTCEFDLTVPASGEVVVDLGEIVCETSR